MKIVGTEGLRYQKTIQCKTCKTRPRTEEVNDKSMQNQDNVT